MPPSTAASKIVHGRYEKLEIIREDLYSYYYLGRSIYTQIQVMIREYKPEVLTRDLVGKLVEKIRQSSQLIHPHILNVVDFCHTETSLSIIYEYMEARTLQDEILQQQFSMVQTLECVGQIVSALRYAARKGAYHGHLTESQILLTAKGQIKILNFGFEALVIEQAMTQHRLIEDAVYIAPEKLLDGRTTAKTEVYALGILMFRMLTKEFPYAPELRLEGLKRNMMNVSKAPRDLNPNVPEYLSRVILRAIEKETVKRYKTVEDLFEDIQLRRSHAPEPTVEIQRARLQADTMDNQSKTKRRLTLAVGLIVLGLLLGGARLLVLHYFTAIPVVHVPNVQGRSYSEASATLKKLGLRVEMSGFADDASIPAGTVIRSRPAAGREVRSGRMISLLVSRGGDSLAIPDIKGQLIEEATVKAGARGLAVVKTGEAYTRVYPPGTIMMQDPPADTPIADHATVEVLISKGYPISLNWIDGSHVRVALQNLKQWDRTQVKVFLIQGTSRKLIFNQNFAPGDSNSVDTAVSNQDVIEVYYGEQLAYTSQDMEYHPTVTE